MTAIDKNQLAPTPAPHSPFTPTSTIPRSTVQAAIEYVYAWFAALVPSVGAAPKDAQYLVAAADGTLTAERVTTDTTSITWDHATAAQAKAKRAALTGDVTASADSNVTTIANDAVAFAKMQNIATDRLIGRDTAASGDPEEISVGGGLEFSGAAGIQRSALTGDVTAAAGSGATTIANDAVTYAKMQNVSATSRVLGRKSALAGDTEECTLSEVLDFVGSAANGDILYRTGGAWARLPIGSNAQVLTVASLLPSWAAGGSPTFPQGRLTVASGTPVVTVDDTANTTIYYCARGGGTGGFYVPIYDGTSWAMTDVGAELSQATTDATKSPAASANNSNYDLFVWSDSGTYRCTRGPAWTSDTGRGVGAGTTELEAIKGILTNKVAITNGPGANRGTYVGTIRTNGTASVDWMLRPAAAAGGTANVLGVWNMYNRVNVAATCRESTDNWTCVAGTMRALNSSNSNRISFVRGLDEDAADAFAFGFNAQTAADYGWTGIGLDSTTAAWDGNIRHPAVTAAAVNNGTYSSAKGLPGLGFHFFQHLEFSAVNNLSFFGDNGDAPRQQTGIQMSMLM